MAVSTRCCADCVPFRSPWGEEVRELCGLACPPGNHSTKASFAKICFEPGVYSRRHSHPEPTEEVFYILNGEGEIEVGGATKCVQAGDTIVIPSGTPHQIGNSSQNTTTLETLVICVPSWEPSNTTWLNADGKAVSSPDFAREKVEPTPWLPLSKRRHAYACSPNRSTAAIVSSQTLAIGLTIAAAMGCFIGMRLRR